LWAPGRRIIRDIPSRLILSLSSRLPLFLLHDQLLLLLLFYEELIARYLNTLWQLRRLNIMHLLMMNEHLRR
jgi:hypothetical protein